MARTLELADEPLFDADPTELGDGRHLVRDDFAGARIFAEVKDGKLAAYSAEFAEEEGDSFMLEMLEASATTCYFCVCTNSNCRCSKVPCP